MRSEALTVDAELDQLQRDTFGYFLHETNPANGLVIDKTAPDGNGGGRPGTAGAAPRPALRVWCSSGGD